MNSGIYMIKNKVNNKFYIGSSNNIKSRWSKHRNLLIRDAHSNQYLQHSWNKHGEGNFEWSIIEYVHDEDKKALSSKLLDRENYWLEKLKPYSKDIGYNICHVANSRLHVKDTEETKRKKSIAMLKPHHQERQRKLMKKIRQDRCILNDNQVLDIVKLFGKGLSNQEISDIYNVHKSTISNIRVGRSWSRVTGIKHSNSYKKLTFNDMKNIVELSNKKYTTKEIHSSLGISENTIREFLRGKTYNGIVKEINELTSHDMIEKKLIDEIL